MRTLYPESDEVQALRAWCVQRGASSPSAPDVSETKEGSRRSSDVSPGEVMRARKRLRRAMEREARR